MGDELMGHFVKWKLDLFYAYRKPEGKVLDLGSGKGELREKMLDKERYFGVDINPEFTSEPKQIKQADITKVLPYENETFSLVWCSHLLEHLLPVDQAKLMKEIYRVLVPGGKLIVFTPAYNPFFFDEWQHIRPHTGDSLKTLANHCKLLPVIYKYSLLRSLPDKWQNKLRWFLFPLLWEIYGVFEK